MPADAGTPRGRRVLSQDRMEGFSDAVFGFAITLLVLDIAAHAGHALPSTSAYWPTADKAPDATPLIVDFARIWRGMPKIVFSRTLDSVGWNSRLERGDPVEVVTKLKAETDGRLEVAGATLAAPIVQAGLVDEYRIVVAPTVVGGGTPFFPTLPSWISLRLLENRSFPGGTVLLRYEVKHD